jgi:hypothetical protein
MSTNSFAGLHYGYNSSDIFKYRTEAMCDTWNKLVEKELNNMRLIIKSNNKGDFEINGNLSGIYTTFSSPTYIKYWAANSPDYLSNFSGSGMPFANEDIAFENSVNKGVVLVSGNGFRILINYPNSYYKNMGTVYVPPEIKLVLVDGNNNRLSPLYEVKLGEGIPFRTQDFTPMRNWNQGPLFYQNIPLVTTQEKILRNSAYPAMNQMPTNFWGFKPAR